MVLHSIWVQNKQKGLTLVEVIVVVAIFILIASLSLVFDSDFYTGYVYRSERAMLVSSLSRARGMSMNNIFNSKHGVCFDQSDLQNKKIIIFQGNSYDTKTAQEIISFNKSINVSSSPIDFLCSSGNGVVFERLSGKTQNVSIELSQNNRSSSIIINNEGRINW